MAFQSRKKLRIGFRQAAALLLPYIGDRLLEQIRAVWLLIVYLVFFQTVILRIKIFEATAIAFGIGLVVIGLAFFMEGLFLGLMRIGGLVGSGLPRKAHMSVVLGFSLILGFLATLAEPSIQVLQMAGKSVKAWEAPLLFLMLTRYSHYLVYAVGAGVGVSVALGMLRFYYNLSLKPFIYLFVGALIALTVWAGLDPNMHNIIGLAWDCGAVTTGPVTVPLVLALGIGVSRMVGSADSGAMGFGVVTLASLLPVMAVLILGLALNHTVPAPMDEAAFLNPENRAGIRMLFENETALTQYLAEKSAIGANNPDTKGAIADSRARFLIAETLRRNIAAALKAIALLTIPIFVVLFLLIKEQLPYPDEIVLGIFLCILGLATFSIGIELGLDKLGTQVGQKLPAAFKSIQLTEGNKVIENFNPNLVQTAVTDEGRQRPFLFIEKSGKISTIPFDAANFDPPTGRYHYTPTKGPLFGSGTSWAGIMVVILFAFIMGYGATLAEPALNALGVTVEEITAGTFKKSLLMQAVATGVGLGIALGVAKIILAIPLVWILAPSYILLLFITRLSTEEFVNIGWDSAGVTTGPITVPLVLAIGLGIGSQVGVVEGFGILAAASVCPILTVLLLGLYINRKRQAALAATSEHKKPQPKEAA